MRILVGYEKSGVLRRALQALGHDVTSIDELPYPTVIENPGRSFLGSMYRKPDQIIHPYEFGDDASKATGL